MAGVVCVGRDNELKLLQDRLDDASRGVGGLVVLEGPAGIGKTTLARWCLDAAARSGGSAHLVAAMGTGLEPPVGIWARLAAEAALAGRDVPPVLLDGAVEQLHPHARYAAVLTLVHELGPRPVVVAIDDLHRTDESSLAILAQLSPALASTGVLVVGTVRGTLSHPGSTGREALEALEPWCSALRLDRLDRDGVRAMTIASAGEDADDWASQVEDLLADRSGGNPLVLQALLDELGVATGARPSRAVVASLPMGAAVTDVLGRRLATLPPSCHELVDVVALVGGEVSPDLVRDVLERDVDADVAVVIGAGVLEQSRTGTGLQFVHPVLAEAVIAGVRSGSPSMNLRIATCLRRQGRPQDLAAVAHHLAAAGPLVSPEEVGAAARAAAEHAMRVGDPAAGARCFDLAIATGTGDEVELLLRASSAHHLAGHRDDGWERARRAADLAGTERPEQLAHAALSYAYGRGYTTDRSGAGQLLRRALKALDADHALRREVLAACSLLEMSLAVPVQLVELGTMTGIDDSAEADGETVAWHWVHRPDIAQPLAEEALELARATGDQELVARVSMAWRQAHCAPEHLAERLAVTTHALAEARLPADRASAAMVAVLDYLEDGRRALVDTALTELVALGASTGDPAIRWRAGQLSAMLAFASGDPALAERRSIDAFAYGAQAGENGRWVVRGVQAVLLSLEVDDDPSGTVDFMATNIDALAYPPMRAGALYGLALAGRHDEVNRRLPALVADVVDDHYRESSWLMTAALAAEVIAEVADEALAVRLGSVLEPYATRIAVDGLGFHCLGTIARPLARLRRVMGRPDDAEALLEQAVSIDRATGLTRFVLAGSVDLLAVRAASGSIDTSTLRAEATAIADQALAAGLTRTEQRARALLQRGGTARLTERQFDVLVALADGLTYQAAGERLGFSHSTIRHEAMRVYATLGAKDRDEAVRIARQRGVIS